MDNEEVIVSLISASGNARSLAMEAIAKAKGGLFTDSELLITQAQESFIEAQKIHLDILSDSAASPEANTPLLTVHAEDQLMSAFLFIDLAQEFRDVYKSIIGLRDDIGY